MSNFKQKQCTKALNALLETYKKDQSPISVDFRQLVDWFPSTERSTHLIHPYPAKLLMHIPYFFLNSDILSKKGDTVLDPFAGSGTVILESLLAGRKAMGADNSPMARLIAKVKTTYINSSELKEHLRTITEHLPAAPEGIAQNVINVDYWYLPHIKIKLQCIKEAIQKIECESVRNFFLVCFSVCVKKASLADPRLSVPVRLRKDKYPKGHKLRDKNLAHLRNIEKLDVVNLFKDVSERNIKRMKSIAEGDFIEEPDLFSDARNLCHNCTGNDERVPDESVDLIITSPPYAGAQKYIRALSLNLGWLGFCDGKSLMQYKENSIGREDYRKGEIYVDIDTGIKTADSLLKVISKDNPTRAHIAANYLVEMRRSIREMNRVLKKGGYLVLVSGNNQVCGQEFDTSSYLRTIAEDLGLTCKLCLIDTIKSRGLMTKRNKTASMITREWVHLFEKR